MVFASNVQKVLFSTQMESVNKLMLYVNNLTNKKKRVWNVMQLSNYKKGNAFQM